jgi:radical SAM protein with 4Fe4S-binding SPASM domain
LYEAVSFDSMNTRSSEPSNADVPSLPRSFVLELTTHCNNRCQYCYNVWQAPELAYARDCPGGMSTREVKDMVVQLQEKTPVAAFILSGGEPMLRSDLADIIGFIRSRGLQTLLVTNGTLLTEAQVDATMAGGMYEVPLLSCRPEIHDRLVGREGAWEAVMEGLMNVHLAGGHLSIVFVATRLNWRELNATAHLAMMVGAQELLYNRINAGAANFRRAEELFLTKAMVEDNLHTLEQIAVKHHFRVRADVVIEPCVVDLRKYPHVEFGWCPLAGEFSSFVIDPAGNFRICEHSPVILGNVKRDSFRDIYHHHPYVEAFRTAWPLECKTCDHPLRDMCRGGCKSAAAQAYGSLEHVEPFVRTHR